MSSEALRRRLNGRPRYEPLPEHAHGTGQTLAPASLPAGVIKGINQVIMLPPAAPASSSAQRRYGAQPSAACVLWLRSMARTVGACLPEPTDSSDDPSPTHDPPQPVLDLAAAYRQFQADSSSSRTFAPMAMRAALRHSSITCTVSAAGTLVPEVQEEEESDGEDGEDDCETMVEPLRQSGAQATVRATVRRRRPQLEPYELVLTNRDLWTPTSITHQYRRREVQELQMLQPWSAMLPDDLRNRSGAPPSEAVRSKHMHAGHYVPEPDDMRRLIAIQNAHTQRLMEVVGTATAAKLGLRDLSALHAANVWSNKYPESAAALGTALSNKCEGLDSLRRERFQGVRMYDLAEYYYKVWRTLHTESAQTHYFNKCKERKREALRDQRQQPRAKLPPPQAVRGIGQRPALVDTMGDITVAVGVNAGSACSSPRAGSASGGQLRNVRPRTDSWGAGAASGGLPSLHSGHSTAQTHQTLPAAALHGAPQPGVAAGGASNAGFHHGTSGLDRGH
eukprot:jgi/Ulvmu1/10288/UM060_0090.1